MRAGLIWGQRLLKFRKNHFEEIPPLFLSKEQYQKQLNILEIMSMSLALSQWESSDCLGHKPLHNTRGPYRAQVFQMGTVLLIRGVVLIQYFVVIKALIWGRCLLGVVLLQVNMLLLLEVCKITTTNQDTIHLQKAQTTCRYDYKCRCQSSKEQSTSYQY